MRIERLSVGGFGRLPSGLTLDFSEGLNLVLAPNEAGKTTLAELLTCLFYGFGQRRGGVYSFEPWQGGEVGGEVIYVLQNGQRFRLRRHLIKRGEKLYSADEHGREIKISEVQPGQLHMGIGRGVFLTVSRLGLEDLQGAFSGEVAKDRKEAKEQLKGYFFQEAATRGEVANPVAVREDWLRQAQALFSKDGRSGRADKELMQKLGEAKAALAQAGAQEEESRRMLAQREELGRKAAELEEARQAAEKELARLRRQYELAQEAARRRDLEAEMGKLIAQGLADEGLENRARELLHQAQTAEDRAGASRKGAEKARAEAQKIGAGRDPVQWEKALAELAIRQNGLTSREEDLSGRRQRLAEQSENIKAQWRLEPAALAALDADLPITLGALQRDLAQAREKVADANQRLAQMPAPPQPLPRWLPFLGLCCAAAGLALLIWLVFFAGDIWAAGMGLALALGGAGLFVWAWQTRQRAAARKLEQDELQARLGRNQDIEQEMVRLLASANLPAESCDPARLAEARVLAMSLEKEDQTLTELESRLQKERWIWGEEAERWGVSRAEEPEAGWQKARGQCSRAANATRETARLDKEAHEEEQRAASLRAELGRVLSSAGLADLEALGQARTRAKKAAELTAKLEEVKKRLGQDGQEGQGQWDQAAVEQGLLKAEARLKQIEDDLREASQEQGRLEQALAQAAQAISPDQARAHLEALEDERLLLARRHDTLILGGALLDQAMEDFRLQAQPRLLQGASDYLARATRGAYKWLGSDLFTSDRDKEPRLAARAGPGAGEHEAEVLSRGTRDQLYLCLRLALADEITQDGEPVPLILDDPLVNFDDARLAATLDLFGELAGKRQVLFLTCHEEQARLLKKAWTCQLLEIR